jgi:transcriptional regulator with XRE-family HTH domain
MYTSFGDRLILLRKKKNLTQEQLAQKAGLTVKELAGFEGDAVSPSFNVAVKLADVLNISLDFLACRIDRQVDAKWLSMAGDIHKMSQENQHAVNELIDALSITIKSKVSTLKVKAFVMNLTT